MNPRHYQQQPDPSQPESAVDAVDLSEDPDETLKRNSQNMALLDGLMDAAANPQDVDSADPCQANFDSIFSMIGGSGAATPDAVLAFIAKEEEELETAKKEQRNDMKRCRDSIEAFAMKQDPEVPDAVKAAKTD